MEQDTSMLEKIWVEIHQIKKALLGDEYNDKGIIQRVKIVEKIAEELLQFKQKIIYMVAGISLAIGGIFTAINYILNILK